MDTTQLALPLAAAAGAAAAATPLVARLARALGIVDRPSPRPVSDRSGMPPMGGLAVAAGFAAGRGVALALAGRIETRGHPAGLCPAA